ncbi:MAG: ribosomal RNA small subunit methyltransferase A [Pedosphaera sp.]|nr:ribosomal RNA small subunit methyltransferase A [Pedosphaera sp.]
MKLKEMRDLLSSEGIQLTKSLGQNFLHDANQLARIVASAELTPGDRVLEIGPGLGPLTQLLLGKDARVLAIEFDRRLVEVLRKRWLEHPGLELIAADALRYVRETQQDWSGWKVVSNLPYSVASPIIVELAQSTIPPERMVVTLQWEVARRLVATEDADEYGVLTLLVQYAYEARGMFKIPSDCFFPVPDVDSACVTLVRRPTPLLPPELAGSFEKVVKRGFSQRRKMMMKLLKADWPEARLKSAYDELSLSPQIRAEKVSLDQFVRLTQLLASPTDSMSSK